MKLAKTIFQNSAIFIEKKWIEKSLVGKSGICGKKELIHFFKVQLPFLPPFLPLDASHTFSVVFPFSPSLLFPLPPAPPPPSHPLYSPYHPRSLPTTLA